MSLWLTVFRIKDLPGLHTWSSRLIENKYLLGQLLLRVKVSSDRTSIWLPKLTVSQWLTGGWSPQPPPTPTPSWRFFRDRAIPFGDSASGDYATCAKVATVQTFIQDSPADLQPAILLAVLEDTYIDDGGVRANSTCQISALQSKIGRILGKGGFHIKS